MPRPWRSSSMSCCGCPTVRSAALGRPWTSRSTPICGAISRLSSRAEEALDTGHATSIARDRPLELAGDRPQGPAAYQPDDEPAVWPHPQDDDAQLRRFVSGALYL